jgi:hypothetical protein
MDDLEERLAASQGANHTFLFGHYPLATLTAAASARGTPLHALLQRGVSLYAAGHLHTLFGRRRATRGGGHTHG